MQPSAESPEPTTRARLEELLVRCRPRLIERIRWMMGKRAKQAASKRDFFGMVCAKLLERPPAEWRDEEHFVALATRIARHLLIDEARRPRLQRVVSLASSFTPDAMAADVTTPSGEAARRDDLEGLFAALEQLSDEHRSVIELRDFEQRSFREIGERLGRSENAAQLLHARARMSLGRILRADA